MATSPVGVTISSKDEGPRLAGTGGQGGPRRAALVAAILSAAALAAVTGRAPAQGHPEPAATPPAAEPAAQKQEAEKPAAQEPQAAKPGAQKPGQSAGAHPAAAPAGGAKPQDQPGLKPLLNIKVLHDMPREQIGPVMHLMRASLGVRCDYCHVLEDGEHYELDTKPAKTAAREMLRMVKRINEESFGGRPVVTCQTCHHGQIHPSQIPPMELGLLIPLFPELPKGGPSQEALANLPSATETLDRYIEALGGRDALEKVQSRVSRGSLLRMGVVEANTPNAHAVNRGQADPLEIVQRLPDKVTVTHGPPTAQVVQTYDGASGTIKTPQGVRPVSPEDAARASGRYDLRKELKLRDHADEAQVIGREKIDGRDMFVLRTKAEYGNDVLDYFDVQTGLLRRQIVLRPTVIGPDPEQTDYEDYRDVGGVKVPFLVKASILDDLHQGTTRKLAEVRNNVE